MCSDKTVWNFNNTHLSVIGHNMTILDFFYHIGDDDISQKQ